MSETTFHFAGDLYIQPYVNGVLGGMIGPIDAESLEIKPDAKKNTIQSKAKATAGQARITYYTPQPATLSIKTSDIPPTMLAAAFMGNEVTVNQGAGTLTDVAITLPPSPKWVSIGKSNIAQAALVVKEGATALAATDYEVNYALGLIRATAGGTVKEGGAVTISGTYNAITGSRIEGNLTPAIDAKLLLDGKNVIDGSPVKVSVPKASLSPKNGVDFLSEKAIEITLEGELMVVTGETAPFYVDQLATA